jgi:hypothetical protein
LLPLCKLLLKLGRLLWLLLLSLLQVLLLLLVVVLLLLSLLLLFMLLLQQLLCPLLLQLQLWLLPCLLLLMLLLVSIFLLCSHYILLQCAVRLLTLFLNGLLPLLLLMLLLLLLLLHTNWRSSIPSRRYISNCAFHSSATNLCHVRCCNSSTCTPILVF